MQRFWNEFEKFSNCKYPKVIKDIFKLCAIDQATFIDITESTIEDIEKIVNKNKSVLKKSCYNSIFEKDEEFKFLFGHRLLLITLPEKYKSFFDDKKEKKNAKKLRFLDLKSESSAHSVDESENFEADGPVLKPERVKQLLLEKLNKHAQKQSQNNYTVNENAVKKFHLKGCEAYCLVQCPFCESKIPCTFTCNWSISNFNKHVRSHFVKNQRQNQVPKTSNSQNPSQKTANLSGRRPNYQVTNISASISVLNEVKKIIG